MSVDVLDEGRRSRLNYVLSLQSGNRAEMTVERTSYIRDTRQMGYDFGSIATLYLQSRTKVSHTGNWSQYNDHVNILLGSIAGRRDAALFFGDYHEGRLRLDTTNRGMYGHHANFEFYQDGGRPTGKDALAMGAAAVVLGAIIAEENRKEQNRVRSQEIKAPENSATNISGDYSFNRRVDNDGSLHFRLRLERGGFVELTSERTGDPAVNNARTVEFGEILRMVSRNDSTRHQGRYKINGTRIEIDLDDFVVRSGGDDTLSTKQARLIGTILGNTIRLDVPEGQSLYGQKTVFTFRR